jgi:hypothetical protein
MQKAVIKEAIIDYSLRREGPYHENSYILATIFEWTYLVPIFFVTIE